MYRGRRDQHQRGRIVCGHFVGEFFESQRDGQLNAGRLELEIIHDE